MYYVHVGTCSNNYLMTDNYMINVFLLTQYLIDIIKLLNICGIHNLIIRLLKLGSNKNIR